MSEVEIRQAFEKMKDAFIHEPELGVTWIDSLEYAWTAAIALRDQEVEALRAEIDRLKT